MNGHNHEQGLPLEPYKMTAMQEEMRTELEAAAFRRLVEHLRERSDVQNIDLMELLLWLLSRLWSLTRHHLIKELPNKA